jgi:hypothetical protein
VPIFLLFFRVIKDFMVQGGDFVNVSTCNDLNLSMIGEGPSWPWSYGRWIYNYLCNQYLSPLTLKVWIPFSRGVLDTTLCDKVCQWLATARWYSLGTLVSSTNKTDRHDIVKIDVKHHKQNQVNDRCTLYNLMWSSLKGQSYFECLFGFLTAIIYMSPI